MNRTIELFNEDAHAVAFTAQLLSVSEEAGGLCGLVLDRTAFFPEQGGQDADKGTLTILGKAYPVQNVTVADGVITHFVKAVAAEAGFTEGLSVEGLVDWNRRFDYMQQHTGEHILSGIAHSLYKCNNVGFHLSEREVTFDLDIALSLEDVRKIELLANEAVYKNIPVSITYPAPEALKSLDYRSKLEITENVRIVTIDGYDCCACCAPHVDTTGQIGMIKVVSVMSHRGGVRITILCGKRALMDYTAAADVVSDAMARLSASREKIGTAIDKLKEDVTKERDARLVTQQHLIDSQLLKVDPNAENVTLVYPALDNLAMRETVNGLVEKHSGYCAVYAGNEEKGYSFIIGSKEQDCNALAGLLRSEQGAKCGGSATMIQGSMKSVYWFN